MALRWTMMRVVVEHVAEGMFDLEWRLQGARVITVRKHSAASSEPSIDGSRDAHA
jgi:hypothetical protein